MAFSSATFRTHLHELNRTWKQFINFKICQKYIFAPYSCSTFQYITVKYNTGVQSFFLLAYCAKEVVIRGVDPLCWPACRPGVEVAGVAVVVHAVLSGPHPPHVRPQQVLDQQIRGQSQLYQPIRGQF